ncbi:hypothetical protein E2C01_025449 [Portunus trituberculatus]|uniref:Uncharacterized protein n=1 Tax=Portunus trituberculatus TaxID=210409 RepID=A0A5B7EHY7_PORTR|nr:hypothetical protein [Portunus trituberculatus]
MVASFKTARGGIRTYTWTSARFHAHDVIHNTTTSLVRRPLCCCFYSSPFAPVGTSSTYKYGGAVLCDSSTTSEIANEMPSAHTAHVRRHSTASARSGHTFLPCLLPRCQRSPTQPQQRHHEEPGPNLLLVPCSPASHLSERAVKAELGNKDSWRDVYIRTVLGLENWFTTTRCPLVVVVSLSLSPSYAVHFL